MPGGTIPGGRMLAGRRPEGKMPAQSLFEVRVMSANKGVLFLIFVLFCSFFLFGLHFSGQEYALDLLHQGASTYLNIVTRDFNRLESENFLLKYSSQDREAAPYILGMAQEYLQDVEERLDYYPGKRKALVVIYPEEKLLGRNTRSMSDKSAAGIYWAGTVKLLSPRAWVPEVAGTGETLQVYRQENPLVHELTHYLIDLQTKGNYTRWLSEGLAQYVEREITGFVLPEPDFAFDIQWYSFDRLEHDYDALPDQTLAYWQSLQAVSCLVDSYGWEKMHNFLETLGARRAFDLAFQETYGFTVHDMETKMVASWQEKYVFYRKNNSNYTEIYGNCGDNR